MNHIVIFCSKTIKEKHDKIDQTDCILKTKVGKAEYEEIRKKKLFHQKKPEKKFYINVSSGNTTTTLNTNPNLLLLRANI